MDRREMNHKWYDEFIEDKMTVIVNIEDDGGEENEYGFPVTYEVCGTCCGKGKHVNPAIDSHGISGEELYNDPDFAEDYFGGRYDISCNECGGKRVVPELDISKIEKDELLKEAYDLLQEKLSADADFERISAMERAMGA